MHDYIDSIIEFPHNPFGNPITYVNRETGEMKNYNQKLDLKNGTTSIRVKSLRDGQAVRISGNPLSFLQQHNLWGCDDLMALVGEVFKVVTSMLNIKVDKLTAQKVEEGEYELSRVDCAFNFRMPDADMVKKAVREIGWCWFEQNKMVSIYPDQTAYLNQHSASWSLKFYDKNKQMISTRMKYPCKEQLLKYSLKLVRAELTLRGPKLRECELNRGSDWSDATLSKRLLIEAINESELAGEVKLHLVPKEIELLSAAMKRTYFAWINGNSIKALYGQATYYRHVAEFKSLGIDLRFPPRKDRVELVKLSELFVEENIATFPKYARKQGLIFIPE
ncbi:MAG: phage/plasmid replication protein, II/X family [Gallionella sp.]|nr:phage/plasmid replication protein, II/X family [Gallionella sp.]